MPDGQPPTSQSLGADLRALRRARGLRLADMAQRLGRSLGWLSQVERDLSRPAIADLRAIAAVLGVPLSLFFGATEAREDEIGYVVRAHGRRRIGAGEGEGELVEELLSPDLTDEFEVVRSTFAPRSRLDEPTRRPTQEVAYLIAGRLDLMIGDRRFTVEAGDSFRIRGEPFTWANPYDAPAVAIWVIAPPVY